MAASLIFTYTGGSVNADPTLSLGSTGSSIEVIDPVPGNLFDMVYPADIESAQHVSYRAIDIYNSGDQTATGLLFFITDTTNSESDLYYWLDPVGTQSIADDTTAPVGATWTQPLVGSKDSLANLAAGARHRLWFRRRVDQGAAALSPDTGTIHCWFSNSA